MFELRRCELNMMYPEELRLAAVRQADVRWPEAEGRKSAQSQQP